MHRKSSLVACTCLVCGADFQKIACRVRQGKGRFCSLACSRAGQRRVGPSANPDRPLTVRFAEKVDRSDPDGCWLWTGSLNHAGYGYFNTGQRTELAHRVAWRLERGPIPDGLQVRHLVCRNPRCVRGEHLALGTRADNMADMARDGSKKGERHHLARLTESQVIDMRRRFAAGGITRQALANEYRVTNGAVHAVLSGKSWSHVGAAAAAEAVV